MFNKVTKNLKGVIALPFVITAIGLVLLHWFFISINSSLIYASSFLLAVAYFIRHGKWKWAAILEETYDVLWWYR